MPELSALTEVNVYTIGLTGGISSGKSTVSAMLEQLGAAIIDTDIIARKIVEPGQPAWQEIVAAFGTSCLFPDGHINRKLLGEIIFTDDHKRRVLDKITHPHIQNTARQALQAAAQQGIKTAVLDAPLLIEVGWQHMVQAVWVVYVDEETQIERLMRRDRLDRSQALARIHSQMSLREKLLFATVVIDNSGNLEATQKQVFAAWQCLAANQ